MIVDVAATIEGSKTSVSRLGIPDSHALTGVVSDTYGTDLPNVGIDFVDYPFKNPRPKPKRHRRVVKQARPKLAVAPDVSRQWPLDRVIDYADGLNQYADTVIVVPKGIDPRRVPDRFRVGIPFQTAWSEEAVTVQDLIQTTVTRDGPATQYADAGPVHLLGGNPDDQLEVARRSEIEVASVDGNNVLAYAMRGRRVWFEWGQLDMSGQQAPALVTWSLDNIYQAWNPQTPLVPGLIKLANDNPQRAISEYQAYLSGRPGTLVDEVLDDAAPQKKHLLNPVFDRMQSLMNERGSLR